MGSRCRGGRDAVIRTIELACRLHRPEHAILAVHRDCGAIGGVGAFPGPQEEISALETSLTIAAETVADHFPTPSIRSVMFDERGGLRGHRRRAGAALEVVVIGDGNVMLPEPVGGLDGLRHEVQVTEEQHFARALAVPPVSGSRTAAGGGAQGPYWENPCPRCSQNLAERTTTASCPKGLGAFGVSQTKAFLSSPRPILVITRAVRSTLFIDLEPGAEHRRFPGDAASGGEGA